MRPDRIERAGVEGEAGVVQRDDIAFVSRQKKLEGRALHDLAAQVARGAEAELEFFSGRIAEGGGGLLERELDIGGGSDDRRRARGRHCEDRE